MSSPYLKESMKRTLLDLNDPFVVLTFFLVFVGKIHLGYFCITVRLAVQVCDLDINQMSVKKWLLWLVRSK